MLNEIKMYTASAEAAAGYVYVSCHYIRMRSVVGPRTCSLRAVWQSQRRACTHVSFPLRPVALERPECTLPRSSRRSSYAAPPSSVRTSHPPLNDTYSLQHNAKRFGNTIRTCDRGEVGRHGRRVARHELLVHLHVGGRVGEPQVLVVLVLLPLHQVRVRVPAAHTAAVLCGLVHLIKTCLRV